MSTSTFYGLVLPCIFDGIFLTVILISVVQMRSGRWPVTRNRPEYPASPPAQAELAPAAPDTAEASIAELREIAEAARVQAEELAAILSDCEVELLNGADEALRLVAPPWLAASRDLADQFRKGLPDTPDAVIGKIIFNVFFYINTVASQISPDCALAIIRNGLVGAAVDLTAVERQPGVT